MIGLRSTDFSSKNISPATTTISSVISAVLNYSVNDAQFTQNRVDIQPESGLDQLFYVNFLH